jgi:hypothetical protein
VVAGEGVPVTCGDADVTLTASELAVMRDSPLLRHAATTARQAELLSAMAGILVCFVAFWSVCGFVRMIWTIGRARPQNKA